MAQYKLRERRHENLLDDLLLARGVAPEEKEIFLNPDFERDSHDPLLLPDMGCAVERILSAKKNNEKTAVWSDYDCDGIPGGAMLAEFLRTLGMQVVHYIPHRHEEGYGLNVSGIDKLKKQNVSLIITVDLGTADHGCISHAKSENIDTIVTDHHLVPMAKQAETSIAQRDGASIANFQQEIMRARRGLVLPEALAVINPKRADSKYPFPDLCGAGVAWKLIQAILQKIRASGQPFDYAQGKEKWLLDLVGLATLSDMVPLLGENRMLAHFGLRVLRRARRPGLSALFSLLRIKPATLTEDDVGFMISPRINAASRMDSPELAARLLIARSAEEALPLAKELDKINDERKGLVAATVKEVNKRLNLAGAVGDLVVMGSPSWRPGILGLVANSLVEHRGGTVCLWGREGGEMIRGSCRSGEVNIVELMGEAGGLEEFGGHRGSGGFSVGEGQVHELSARFSAAYEKVRAQTSAAQEIFIDRELDLAEASHAQKNLERLAPFGIGFEKPLFIFPGVSIGGIRAFGKQQNHLELRLSRHSTPLGINGIAFFSGIDSFSKKIAAGDSADIVGHIERDWRGAPRLRIVDVI